MPKVSVIIATYNRPHLLPRAMEGARAAGADVEVVVVDDASSDETADVCNGYHDTRYVRAARNLKVAGARKLGVLASSGEYISFLDDDDVRPPKSLSVRLEALASAPGAEFGAVTHILRPCCGWTASAGGGRGAIWNRTSDTS